MNKIQSFRKRLGLSVDDMAKSLGVCSASIRRWENGTIRTPKMAILACEHIVRGAIETAEQYRLAADMIDEHNKWATETQRWNKELKRLRGE